MSHTYSQSTLISQNQNRSTLAHEYTYPGKDGGNSYREGDDQSSALFSVCMMQSVDRACNVFYFVYANKHNKLVTSGSRGETYLQVLHAWLIRRMGRNFCWQSSISSIFSSRSSKSSYCTEQMAMDVPSREEEHGGFITNRHFSLPFQR